ncbi:MFS transporter [Streptomyces sp. RFCAC02]|uniref:MFS transporter n=1 Tax=Streptomyces sp. RFCAC02 TaxID=2499143 RepID=UPI00102019E2|nr:MFS transporter [Streptomyces sp. RFCAC02]
MTLSSTPPAPPSPSASAGPPAPAAPAPAAPERPGRVLAVVLAGLFMALLDVFIVNVAAPTIRTDLGASDSGLQLAVAGYTISYAVLLITGARLGGRFGPGRLYLAGLGTFTAASLACGLAPGTGTLIAFRLAQGTGAALMMPQVLSLIQLTFTGAARGRALRLYATVIATGAAAGQIVGGALISADLFGLAWRPVFLVNVPFGIALLVVGARVLPAAGGRPPGRARPLDPAGLVLLSASVLLLTVPLVLGQDRDWPAWCLWCLAASLVPAALFAAQQARTARTGGAPLISPRMLRTPGVLPGALSVFLSMAVTGGLTFSVSLHVQGPDATGGLAYGALHAGLTFIPQAVGYGLASLYWGKAAAVLRHWTAAAGFLVAGASMAVTGLLLRDGRGVDLPVLLVFTVTGLGLGLSFSASLNRTLASVRPEEAPDASGLLGMMTQLGMLAGIAALGTLFLGRADSAHSTADALWPTMIALSAAAVVGALAAARLNTAARGGR